MSLQLHRPDGEGGIEPRTVSEQNWRRQLRSPRWGTSLRGERLPEHRNTEMEPTSRGRSLLFWLALGAATFVLLVAGYSTGFWGPAGGAVPDASPAADARTSSILVPG